MAFRSTPIGFLFAQNQNVPARYIEEIERVIPTLSDDQKASLRQFYTQIEEYVASIHEFMIDSPWRKKLTNAGFGAPSVLFIPVVAQWPSPGEGDRSNRAVRQWMQQTGFYFLQDGPVRTYMLNANLVLPEQLEEFDRGTERDVWWVGSPLVELNAVERYMKAGNMLTTKIMMDLILMWFIQSWMSGEIQVSTEEDP